MTELKNPKTQEEFEFLTFYSQYKFVPLILEDFEFDIDNLDDDTNIALGHSKN